ncbi:DUF2635 domain-containing protein [Pseudomonas sp. zfem005]|uniref:DUF2635 domain-containing protein n=1 Tax=Pseudomonas sp. zfem005 TaxID=3078200 RepID=UPI00292910E7|nr:DUF2635 domain-containing protein [Pseudomonas sp. zfem005]MDU9415218.1 DUF2635 domain-containing protein [Pseudomonas sp. zfem005]
MKRIYVTPVPDRVVPNPAKGGAYLPAKGEEVDHGPYWVRRLSDGDVIEGKPKAGKPGSETGGE